jgi:hypothetical protein
MDQSAAVKNKIPEIMTLPLLGLRPISIQLFLLFCASFLFPAAAHLSGLPVRYLLPMHWPVIFVGLCYGWRAGTAVGLAAPGLSYLISGMPLPAILPAMTLELAAYGFITGFFREMLRWNGYLSVLTAIVSGRILFLSTVLLTGAAGDSFPAYLKAAMIPGLAAAAVQTIILPIIAKRWVKSESNYSPPKI